MHQRSQTSQDVNPWIIDPDAVEASYTASWDYRPAISDGIIGGVVSIHSARTRRNAWPHHHSGTARYLRTNVTIATALRGGVTGSFLDILFGRYARLGMVTPPERYINCYISIY